MSARMSREAKFRLAALTISCVATGFGLGSAFVYALQGIWMAICLQIPFMILNAFLAIPQLFWLLSNMENRK